MTLSDLRTSLNDVDHEINNLLAQRFFICMQIALQKKQNNMPIIDETAKDIRKKIYSKVLGEYGLCIYETIHEQSVKLQKQI